jgi:hypothetical protein
MVRHIYKCKDSTKEMINRLHKNIPSFAYLNCSVADPGCFSRIRIFSIPDRDPGSRIRIKEFKYFNPKIVSKLWEIGCGMFIPDPDLDFYYPSRIPGSEVKNLPNPGFRILIRNTA